MTSLEKREDKLVHVGKNLPRKTVWLLSFDLIWMFSLRKLPKHNSLV